MCTAAVLEVVVVGLIWNRVLTNSKENYHFVDARILSGEKIRSLPVVDWKRLVFEGDFFRVLRLEGDLDLFRA